MTATCREACCNAAPRRTVSELFERGFRRSRQPPLAVGGMTCRDAEGQSASFSLDVADGRIARISFRASACATLIAYCELIAELAIGARIEMARGLTSDDLVAALPGVHPFKQVRAALAVAALRAVLVAAADRDKEPTVASHPWGENR